MQISRHWRLKNQRYRLQGLRNQVVNTAQPTTVQAVPATEQEKLSTRETRVVMAAGR